MRVHRALEVQGHHILAVPHAAIALGVLRHVQFNILVAPLAPLTISARDLAAQAKLLQPELRVLVLDELELGWDLLYSNVDAYIQKPISDLAFGEAVQRLLSRSGNAAPSSHTPRSANGLSTHRATDPASARKGSD
jgi:DNA-binding response OmpR family regulator